jgi:hypothetical protein
MNNRYDLKIYTGDTFKRTIDILIGETPLDLFGSTVKAQIRYSNADSVAAEFTSEFDPEIVNRVVITLSSEQTAALTRPGVWDLQVTNADGETTTYLVGRVFVTHDVTR